MRVLYLIDSLVGGGAEQSLAGLAPHLAPRGVDLHVAYLLDRPGLQDVFASHGVPLHLLDATGRVGWMRAAADAMRRVRPDLVHTTLFESN
ncbi:MAG: glycosyltransferase, partial [Actinomycetota bacterium]|nr:glycosyltransferase [Actinomycetota bacterium]